MLNKFMKYIVNVDTENLKYIECIIITSKILISNRYLVTQFCTLKLHDPYRLFFL